MAAHRYWRLNVTANNGDALLLALLILEMYESNNGANVTKASLTAADSSHQTGYEGSNTINQAPGSAWVTQSGTTTGWVSVDFGAGVTKEIVAVGLGIGGTIARAPKNFDIQYSDNNSSWSTAWSVADYIPDVIYKFRRFYQTGGLPIQSHPWGAHVYWRHHLYTNTVDDYLACKEAEWLATPSGNDQATGGTASASTTFSTLVASQAFDDDTTTAWASNLHDIIQYQWLKYQFGSAVQVARTTFQCDASGRGPAEFYVQYSDDDISWSTAWKPVTQAAWSASEKRTFDDPNYVAAGLWQTHYRFRTDADAVDATPTWGANEDTTYNPGTSNFRLRVKLERS